MADLDLARIKSNVAKMVQQGAPEADIDAYISAEGTSVDAVRNFQAQPAPSLAHEIVSQGAQGFNEGIDATLNLPGSLVNLGSRAIGYGDVIPPIRLASRFNSGEQPTSATGRVARTAGEVVGGAALPEAGIATAAARAAPAAVQAGRGLISEFAAAPARTLYNDTVSTLGAGIGAGEANEHDLGPLGEIAAGIGGGIAAPRLLNVTANMAIVGAPSAARYAGRAVAGANTPKIAATNAVARRIENAGTTPEAIRDAILPEISSQLRRRGIDEGAAADIISRLANGETARSIATDHGISAHSVSNLMKGFRAQNPTPMTITDIVKDLSEEARRNGTSERISSAPLARLGRSSVGIADEDGRYLQSLIDRQLDQPGRVGEIIQQSGGKGVLYEDRAAALAGPLKRDENVAYTAARNNAHPFNLRPVLRQWALAAPVNGGEIGRALFKARALFLRSRSAMGSGGKPRFAEYTDVIGEPPAPASGTGIVPQGRFAVGGAIGNKPSIDLDEFLKRRYELDQMISAAKDNGRATPVSRELSKFRRQINDVVHKANPELAKADALFAGNRTAQNLLKRGAKLGVRLAEPTREAIADFRSMTPEQRELFRIGFERSITEAAFNKPYGSGAANQFRTPAFDFIIQQFYPRAPSKLTRAARQAANEVHMRGQNLLNRLRRESYTTSTLADYAAGARTAPLAEDIRAQMQDARAAADALVGRWGRLVENLSDKLAKQIGRRQAEEKLRILTATAPEDILPALRDLARASQSPAERLLWNNTIHDFIKARPSAVAKIGTATTALSPAQPQ